MTEEILKRAPGESAGAGESANPAAAGTGGASAPDAGSQRERPSPPGLVAIQGGKVVVQLPSPDSPRPSITPGAYVVVEVNGTQIHETTTIDVDDDVAIRALPEEPVLDIRIEVPKSAEEAVAHVVRRAGTAHEVKDAPFAPHVTVAVRPVGTIPPPELTAEAVKKALADAGVVFGIDEAAIEQMIARPEAGFHAVVARAKPPTPPVDSHAKPTVKEETVAEVQLDEPHRVDLLYRGEIFSVQEGEVVAEWVDAQPGVDGTDVLGRPIPAKKPKVRALKLGSGARRAEGSKYIVAARTGRPVVKETFVDVVPSYEVPADVNVATGHIDFAGDVTVRRNVEESLKVRAGGSVIIGGMVFRKARVEAGGSVRVRGVVGGSISAGGNTAVYGPLIEGLGRLAPLVQKAAENLRRVEEASRATGKAFQIGVVFKALLERHFAEAQKVAQSTGAFLAQRKDEFEMDLVARIATALRILVGRGPLLVKSFDEIEAALEELRLIPAELEARIAEADVIVEYLQNAEIACGGKVQLVGKACYNSKVIARKGFEAPAATIRGGSITVTHGSVVAREIGSPSAVVTEIAVPEDGSIKADVIHPNVRCIVGHRQYRFEITRRRVVLHLDRETGELRF